MVVMRNGLNGGRAWARNKLTTLTGLGALPSLRSLNVGSPGSLVIRLQRPLASESSRLEPWQKV